MPLADCAKKVVKRVIFLPKTWNGDISKENYGYQNRTKVNVMCFYNGLCRVKQNYLHNYSATYTEALHKKKVKTPPNT